MIHYSPDHIQLDPYEGGNRRSFVAEDNRRAYGAIILEICAPDTEAGEQILVEVNRPYTAVVRANRNWRLEPEMQDWSSIAAAPDLSDDEQARVIASIGISQVAQYLLGGHDILG